MSIKMPVHLFDTDTSAKYGTNAAVILYNIKFWIEKNEANNKHFYDGVYWTYNSIPAFKKIFYYLTVEQIKYSLERLLEAGEIYSGHYNSDPRDRTRWFSIEKPSYLSSGKDEKSKNGTGKFPGCTTGKFPGCYTDINTDIEETSSLVTITENTQNPENQVGDKSPHPSDDGASNLDDLETSKPVRKKSVSTKTCQAILNAYNNTLSDKLPSAQILSTKRLSSINARYKELINTTAANGKVRFTCEKDAPAWFASLFKKVRMNPHWMGENDMGWTANFDWIMLPNNFIKILEYMPKRS